MNETILAVDVGSSSVRAMLSNAHGVELSGTFTQIKTPFDRTPDGGATFDADRLCEAVFACIDGALGASGGAPVTQVVIDTFVTSLLGVDAHGKPSTPLFTWSDGRGAALVPALKARLEPDAALQRTGTYLHPSYWPLRLVWLRATSPEAFAATRQWLSLGAYLLQRIFGRPAMSVSDAAWTGMLNRHTLAWDGETLDALAITPDRLPEIRGASPAYPPPPFPTWSSAQKASALQMADPFARRWPALREARWHPAIGDGAASNIGAGCVSPDRVALSLGTSGALRVIVPGTPERVPDGLFCYRIDAGRSLIGGALSNVGSIFDWLTRTLRLDTPDAVESALAALPPDGHGLTVLPFLAPERSPFWDDRFPAVITGMTSATAPLDILRAHLEAVAYGFSRIAQRLMPLLPPVITITASGAAVERSPALMQILADVLGHPIAAAPESEATIRGAVLFHTGERAADQAPSRIYTPERSHAPAYAAAIARQDALLRQLAS